MPLSPNIAAQYADGVAEAYRDAELDILRAIAWSLAEGIDTPDWQLKALARAQTVRQQVIGILARVDPIAASRMLADITAAYGAGQTAMLSDLRGAFPALELAPTLQGQAAVIGLVEEARGAVSTAGQSMLRAVDDIYRDVTIKATASTLTGGSQKLAVQRALNTLAGKGLQAVTLQSGRKMGIGDYVTMAVRTATARAAFSGADETMGQAGIDLCRVLPGPRACDICDKWARKVLARTGAAGRRELTDVTNGRKFTITVDDTLAAAYRGGWGHVNCFPVFQPVGSPTGLRGADTRRYKGEVVVVDTAAGRQLTVTPNHPVLTTEGWVSAGALVEGMHVLSYHGGLEGVGLRAPDHERVESGIGQVYEALRESGHVSARTVPGAPKDFHGDGIADTDVEVVLADRLLWTDGEAQGLDGFDQRVLSGGGAGEGLFLPGSALAQVLQGATRSTDGIVGGSGQGASFFRRSAGHAHVHAPGAVADFYASLDEPAAESGAGYAEGEAELLEALTGLVSTDEVVHVERSDFDGHVYNLESGGGWYTADSIVVHNCRCSLEPFIPGVTKKTDLIERPKWDQAGYEAQQKQRGIERQIRAWKAREAVAIDPADAAAAKRQVRGYQQQMRDHLAANPDLKRQSGREQVNGSMTGNPKYARVVAR